MTDIAVALDRLAEKVGADNIVTDAEALAPFAVDGVTPSVLVHPADEEGVAATLAWANAAGLAVVPRGAGTAPGITPSASSSWGSRMSMKVTLGPFNFAFASSSVSVRIRSRASAMSCLMPLVIPISISSI